MQAIAGAGHKVASHGWALPRGRSDPGGVPRRRDPGEKALEDLSGQEVKGYRAASFSIDRTTWWAFDQLAEAGYRYSSRSHPTVITLRASPTRRVFRSRLEDNPLTEIPVGTLVCGGGGCRAPGAGSSGRCPTVLVLRDRQGQPG